MGLRGVLAHQRDEALVRWLLRTAPTSERARAHQVRAALDPGDLDLATLWNELGMLGKYTGRFACAARCYRRAQAILTAAYGPDHPELATLYHNLGIDPRQTFKDHAGRPFPILGAGEPIAELM